MSKTNQFSGPLFAIGAVVALAGIMTNIPAAQAVMAATPEAAGGVQQQLLTWLASLGPAVIAWIGEQIYAAMKAKGINVGPVSNVHNAVALLIDQAIKKDDVAEILFTLKSGQKRLFTLDELAKPKPLVTTEVLS